MSIAVSVVVEPSRSLFALELAICLGVALVGILIGCGVIGETSRWLQAMTAMVCLLLALAGFARIAGHKKSYHLDISGAGQIRLHVLDFVAAEASRKRMGETDSTGNLVDLIGGSTFWPGFAMLRLRAEDGQVHVVPILPDCLPAESFRALLVACRWIAARNLRSDRLF